jgi:chromosome segregation ATPase
MEISEFIAEIDDLKAKQEQDHLEIAKLNEELAEAKAKSMIVLNEKADLETRVKTQSKRIDELEKELVRVNNVSKSASQQSQEFSKLKSETNKETIRLLQDIEVLQEQVYRLSVSRTPLELACVLMTSM